MVTMINDNHQEDEDIVDDNDDVDHSGNDDMMMMMMMMMMIPTNMIMITANRERQEVTGPLVFRFEVHVCMARPCYTGKLSTRFWAP